MHIILAMCQDPDSMGANAVCAKVCRLKPNKKYSGGACDRNSHTCNCTDSPDNFCQRTTPLTKEGCQSSCIDSGKFFGGRCINEKCQCQGQQKLYNNEI